jgi:hypothetical protein
MSRRRTIRVAVFVALLMAWPIAVEWARRRFPTQAGVHGIPAVASLIIYVACAAALQSRVIAGLVAGVLVWALVHPFPEDLSVQEWYGRLFLWSVIGFFVGIGWEGIHSLKPPDPDAPGIPKG